MHSDTIGWWLWLICIDVMVIVANIGGFVYICRLKDFWGGWELPIVSCLSLSSVFWSLQFSMRSENLVTISLQFQLHRCNVVETNFSISAQLNPYILMLPIFSRQPTFLTKLKKIVERQSTSLNFITPKICWCWRVSNKWKSATRF